MAAQADAVFVDRNNATIAKDGKLFAQAELRDANLVDKVRPGRPVQGFGEGIENGIVMLSVAAKLSNRLRYQHVEPVQAFRLVAVDVVVRLAQDGSDGQRRRVPQDGGLLAVQGLADALAGRA